MSVNQIRIETRMLPQIEHKNNLLNEMDSIVKLARKEKRSLSTAEQNRFNSAKLECEKINDELEEKDKKDSGIEMRQIKGGRVDSPVEVRGYKKNESISKQQSSNVTIGDLIYSHVTGKFRNEEVRASLSTTSGGLAVPTEVYKDFIDKLRNQSILGECTVYPMNSQTLSIPRATGDIVPEFKVENELVTESNPIFSSVQLQAKPMYAMTSVSLELIEASNLDVGQVITQIMVGSMRAFMQNAMFNGAPNGYAGILNDPYLGFVDAGTAPLDYGDIGAGVLVVRNANGEPTAFVANASNIINLQLAKDTTGQFIAPPAFMKDLTVFNVGSDLAPNKSVVGDLSSIAWGILSEGGLQLEIDKSGEAFSRGQVKIRARINGDFALTNPKLIASIQTV